MNPERSASITEITSKGKRSYRLDLGADEKGKRVTHDFHSRDSAETFKKICEEAWAEGLPTPIPDLGVPIPTKEASVTEVENPRGVLPFESASRSKVESVIIAASIPARRQNNSKSSSTTNWPPARRQT